MVGHTQHKHTSSTTLRWSNPNHPSHLPHPTVSGAGPSCSPSAVPDPTSPPGSSASRSFVSPSFAPLSSFGGMPCSSLGKDLVKKPQHHRHRTRRTPHLLSAPPVPYWGERQHRDHATWLARPGPHYNVVQVTFSLTSGVFFQFRCLFSSR